MAKTSITIVREPVPRDGARAGASSRCGWLRRLCRPVAFKAGCQPDAFTRLNNVRAVLEQARETVARGWVQDRWYVVPRCAGGGSAGKLTAAEGAPKDVAGACVAGAIALAVRRRNARADLAVDAGPAIDYVWDAVQDASGGLDMPAVARRAWPREVRVSRIRDIARWNDEDGRSKAEVLAVLDDAVSRVIMSAMRQRAESSP
jgi:hypothetical protein